MSNPDETQELAPVVYDPQAKRKRSYTPPQSKDSGTCGAACPCGGKCVMHGRYHHVYHSCNRRDCTECHDPMRFKVGAK